MRRVRNLTPHSVTVFSGDSSVTIEPESEVARLSTSHRVTDVVDRVEIGDVVVDVVESVYGTTVFLPEYDKDVYLIVSGLIRDAFPYRTDLVSPGGIVKEGGKTIGCSKFIKNTRAR